MSYPSEWQDFDPTPGVTKRLDTWVFDQYWKWLERDASIYKTQDKIILFFHLLGCDTAGHAAKPMSKCVSNLVAFHLATNLFECLTLNLEIT